MQELAQQLGKPAEATLFGNLAAKAAQAFENSYWYAGGQYFYDCLNPDNSPDPTLRPNQILALAVAPELVSPDKAKAALTKVSEKLAVPLGLRSLSPNDPNYKPTYGGDQFQRDSAYHQGTVWGWLIGGYGTALAHFYPEKATSERLNLLEPFKQHLNEAAIGQVNEIFGAEPPFPPVGCVAQAWSVSHLLELWELL
jgi:glycogen debranching enzyme